MSDSLTPSQRHDCMSHIRSVNTKPEITVRRELWRRGYRYRLNVRKLPGTPDVVIGKYRTIIFINGCFWHGHKGCSKYTVPKTNVKFWKEKVARNQERDLLSIQRLETIAWNIITVWECELSKSTLPQTMDRIETEIKANKLKWEAYQAHRREDRQFARDQARKRREISAQIEAELQTLFHIPGKIRKASRENPDICQS